MNKILKGAVVGGAIGVIAPVTLGVVNDFLWSLNSDAGPRICFDERLWSLQRIKVVHAKGCRNKIFDSIPFCLLIGVLGGSLISSLSLITKETQKQSKDSSAEPASTSTPPTPVAGIKPPTAPVEKKLTIPSISLPSISPQINQGVSRLKGLDWNTIAKGTAVAGGMLVIGFGAVNLLKVGTSNSQGGETTSTNQGSQRSDDQNSGYCGKSVNGFTVCIQEADVTCSEEQFFSTILQEEILGTSCRANGTSTDLSGKSEHYTDDQNCKKINADQSVIYESENEFACLSAKHYGLFQ